MRQHYFKETTNSLQKGHSAFSNLNVLTSMADVLMDTSLNTTHLQNLHSVMMAEISTILNGVLSCSLSLITAGDYMIN